MIPLFTKCYVENEGIGTIEAVCNDSPNHGASVSYCVRLKKDQSLQWFKLEDVSIYDGPDEDEDEKDKSKSSDS